MGSLRPSSSTAVTDVASGRSARMITPSGPGCAPSTECGSWCWPATIRSISPRLTSADFGSGDFGAGDFGPATLRPATLEPATLGSGCVITGHSISVADLQLGNGL